MDSYSSYHTNTGDGDFQRLSQKIGSNVQKISQNVSSIQRMVNQLGGPQDNGELQAKLHQIQHYTNQLAKDTNKYLKDLSAMGLPSNLSEQRQWKMQKERLTTEFSNTLEAFQRAQRQAAEKEKESVKQTRAHVRQRGLYDDETHSQPQLIQLESPVQSQATMQMEEEANLELLREREQAIQQLEADILDVNQIFKELATMIHEQGDTIDSIESSVESAAIHVTDGTEQLQKARHYQSRYRRKMCMLITIATIVLSLVIAYIIWSVKS